MGARKPEEKPTCPPGHSHKDQCYKIHGCRCPKCRSANSASAGRGSRKRSIKARKPGLIVSARGTRRRLEALAFMGWGLGPVADKTGLSRDNLNAIRVGRLKGCQARTYILVARAYDEMSLIRPRGRSADYVRIASRRKGWPGPMHWDDIDRDEEPHGEGV